MDKEAILAAARSDKYRGQEYENRETTRSSLLSSAIALFVGVILYCLEYFIKDSVNVGLIAVGMTVFGVDALYEGLKLKRYYMTAIGIICSLIAVAAIVIFIRQVVSA